MHHKSQQHQFSNNNKDSLIIIIISPPPIRISIVIIIRRRRRTSRPPHTATRRRRLLLQRRNDIAFGGSVVVFGCSGGVEVFFFGGFVRHDGCCWIIEMIEFNWNCNEWRCRKEVMGHGDYFKTWRLWSYSKLARLWLWTSGFKGCRVIISTTDKKSHGFTKIGQSKKMKHHRDGGPFQPPKSSNVTWHLSKVLTNRNECE